jgi:hypothetical protein
MGLPADVGRPMPGQARFEPVRQLGPTIGIFRNHCKYFQPIE